MSTKVTGRNRQILEARQLFQRVLDGDLRAKADLMESMSRSDFPILLGAAYGRELLQEYQAITPQWSQFSRRATVPNFKKQKLVEILGGRAALDKVGEGAEYKARAVSEAEYDWSVDKYGNRIPLTWEMLVDDELDAFRDLPQRLAVAARETEDILTVAALLNPKRDGLNTSFFKAANGNAPANVPLTRDNLEDALFQISQRRDADGRPIVITGSILMVPSTLEMQALRILEAQEIRRTNADGTETVESNYLRGRVTLVVNPWLNIVNKGAKANETWFVLPSTTSARPALVTGFLRGHETPDLRVKADTGNRVGGGAVAPEEGSFDDDTIQYRVRHVIGASTLLPGGTFASTGS